MPAEAAKQFMSALFDAAKNAPLIQYGFFTAFRALHRFFKKDHFDLALFVQFQRRAERFPRAVLEVQISALHTGFQFTQQFQINDGAAGIFVDLRAAAEALIMLLLLFQHAAALDAANIGLYRLKGASSASTSSRSCPIFLHMSCSFSNTSVITCSYSASPRCTFLI